MGKKGLAAAAVLLSLLMTGCGPGEKYADHGARVLMEASGADWTREAEAFWGLSGLGRPYGTAFEEAAFDPEKALWQVSFDLREPVTQTLMDGYAQAVWNACLQAGGQPESSSGFGYTALDQAERGQEPLNYYLWYYHAGNKRFQVGLYSSDMAEGRPGGLVLEVRRWK